MLPAQHWAYSFSIGAEDVDSITNLLLDRETPLSAVQLATEIIDKRERKERARHDQKFQDTKVYRPADTYQIGDRLTFSHFDYATARVVSLRDGTHSDLSPIRVAAVAFENANALPEAEIREFVVEYEADHPLNDLDLNRHPSQLEREYTVDEILNDPDTNIVDQVNDSLERNLDLVRIAGTWFVRELMVEVDIGHLHLAEAVLDMHGGGPLEPQQILGEMWRFGRLTAPAAIVFAQLLYESGRTIRRGGAGRPNSLALKRSVAANGEASSHHIAI